MARSISRAVQDDGATVAILMADERRCAQDRGTACRMSGQRHEVANIQDKPVVDDDVLLRLGSINLWQNGAEANEDALSCLSESVTSYSEQETGESSAWALSRVIRHPKDTALDKHECIACLEMRETVLVPCQHRYCKPCVLKLVNDAMLDESLFPLRCCRQEMPMSLLRPHLSADLATKLEKKAIEYGTHCRTYCYSCGTFINPDDIQGHSAHCKDCDVNTCMFCRYRFHEGACPKDPALDAVLHLAREVGWQRCTQCQNMIERGEGCNHIT